MIDYLPLQMDLVLFCHPDEHQGGGKQLAALIKMFNATQASHNGKGTNTDPIKSIDLKEVQKYTLNVRFEVSSQTQRALWDALHGSATVPKEQAVLDIVSLRQKMTQMGEQAFWEGLDTKTHNSIGERVRLMHCVGSQTAGCWSVLQETISDTLMSVDKMISLVPKVPDYTPIQNEYVAHKINSSTVWDALERWQSGAPISEKVYVGIRAQKKERFFEQDDFMVQLLGLIEKNIPKWSTMQVQLEWQTRDEKWTSGTWTKIDALQKTLDATKRNRAKKKTDTSEPVDETKNGLVLSLKQSEVDEDAVQYLFWMDQPVCERIAQMLGVNWRYVGKMLNQFTPQSKRPEDHANAYGFSAYSHQSYALSIEGKPPEPFPCISMQLQDTQYFKNMIDPALKEFFNQAPAVEWREQLLSLLQSHQEVLQGQAMDFLPIQTLNRPLEKDDRFGGWEKEQQFCKAMFDHVQLLRKVPMAMRPQVQKIRL